MGVVRRLISRLRPETANPTNRNSASDGRRRLSNPSTQKDCGLGFETMEDRLVMDVAIGGIGNYVLPSTKDLFVPIPATDTDGLAVQFQARSNDEDVKVEVLQGGRSLVLNVSGVDKDDVPFAGAITIRLFEDLAPKTTAHIIELAQQGFYNGLDFHRIIDNFMAQGGDGGNAGNSHRIDDEFDARLTFTSPGLIAMANAGDDTGTTQIFITDIDVPYSQLPQHLNFDHTIFGQVTSGFDVLHKVLTVETDNSEQADKPVHAVVIHSATVITDNHNAVLHISGADDFRETATITVTATNANGQTDEAQFTVRGEEDTVNDRPFLGPVDNLETKPGQSVTFTATATDLDGDSLTYSISKAGLPGTTPPELTVEIDQATGKITLTPVAGYEGTLDLLLTVSDGSLQDSQRFQLQVTSGLTRPIAVKLASESNTGPSVADNFTSDPSPTIEITARASSTVEVLVNGASAGTATEVSPGKYTFKIPAGKLGLGTNSITTRTISGNDVSAQTDPLKIVYQPNLKDVFVVPGVPGGESVELRFEFTSKQAKFANEFGVFVVDTADGSINGIKPGEAGYTQAALASSTRQTIFSQSSRPGEVTIITAQPGQLLGFYFVSNGSADAVLQNNPGNGEDGPNVFFGTMAANPDAIKHMVAVTDAVFGEALYAWEDTFGGGDQDFNDMVVGVRLASKVPPVGEPTEVLTVPGSGRTQQQLLFEIFGKDNLPMEGEFGFFYVDDAQGRIGNTYPVDSNYAQLALDPARRQTLFAAGDTVTSTTISIAGQSRIGFYFIPKGTSQDVLGRGARVLFSFDVANAGRAEHFRWFGDEHEARPLPGESEPLRLSVLASKAGLEDFVVNISYM